MGEDRPGRRSQVRAGALSAPDPFPSVVRVRPDITGLTRTFDYSVPAEWSTRQPPIDLRVGGRVRVDLHNRRVGAWIVEVDPADIGIELQPLQRWSGHGPGADTVALADWMADRWLGSPVHGLRTASPPRNVNRIGPPVVSRSDEAIPEWAERAFNGPGATVRLGPGADRWPLVLAAASRGNPLLLVPTAAVATRLAQRLRRVGLRVALMPDDWALAAAGAVVVGNRAAVLAPLHEPGAVVVFDEHDEAWREERAPTWHAREVAVERARRLGVPCVLVSPSPSIEASRALPLIAGDRRSEHASWPTVQIVDRRDEPPGRLGLFSEQVARRLRAPGRAALVLNRVGRVRLLACAACGELATCAACSANVRQVETTTLTCNRCEATRPPACAQCGSSRLKNVVLAVGRAREELEALVGEPVGEVTAEKRNRADARVVIGTEALLRNEPGERWATVVFLDFDQHLGARRQSAESDAMALLVMAARHLGARQRGGRLLIQTRQPEHRVLTAAQRGDTGPLTSAWAEMAEAMRWPPMVGQAEVSGAGAAAYIASVGNPIGLEVLGPREDRWLLRSSDASSLSAALRTVERPAERLRIAVS